MSISVEKLNVEFSTPEPCKAKVGITVPAEEVKKIYNDCVKNYKKQAKIPGFRPGKTPDKMILKKFGTEILNDTKGIVLEEAMKAYISSNEDIKVETYPDVENISALEVVLDSDFTFTATFDVAPEFEIPEYKGIEVELEENIINDDDVQESIGQWLATQKKYNVVERPAEAGDIVKASYDADFELPENEEEVPASVKYVLKAENTWVTLKEPELLPGVSKVLEGAEAGQIIESEIVFPEDYREEMLAGKTVAYKFNIHEINAMEDPELTDELAQTIGMKDVEDLKTKVRSNLESRMAQMQDQDKREAVIKKLVEATNIEAVPPAVLEGTVQQHFQHGMQTAAQQGGLTEEEMEAKKEEIMTQAKESALNSLKINYICREIAEKENISVDPQQVDATISMYASQTKTPVKALKKRLIANGAINEIISDMRNNNVIQFVVDQAVVKTVASEE